MTAPTYFEHVDKARREFDLVEWEDPEEITVRIVALTPERVDEIRRQIAAVKSENSSGLIDP
jgi:hypothetical protein